ncbi:MAG TPA: hypothetical protein VMB82_09960 [Acidimicrobiales bacterium]|nr:hypothetical protein [Acidimicrobiales bacterium]
MAVSKPSRTAARPGTSSTASRRGEPGAEESVHQAPLLELSLQFLLVEASAPKIPERLEYGQEDDDVQGGDHIEERSRHRGAHNGGDVVQPRACALHLLAQRPDAEVEQHCQDEDDAGVAEREEEPDAHRSLPLGHELPGRVVDGRDVVGVKGVAHAEGERQDAGADPEHLGSRQLVVVGRGGKQQGQAHDEQGNDGDRHPANPGPLRTAQVSRRPFDAGREAGTGHEARVLLLQGVRSSHPVQARPWSEA